MTGGSRFDLLTVHRYRIRRVGLEADQLLGLGKDPDVPDLLLGHDRGLQHCRPGPPPQSRWRDRLPPIDGGRLAVLRVVLVEREAAVVGLLLLDRDLRPVRRDPGSRA